ncbi:MAG: metalloregulator ArsR/SmtB family transcription factor [Actinomycetota bacterium]|nr:metalloregulator ArsR/SmtB family transcription factor [Actinomycetota bacterium]
MSANVNERMDYCCTPLFDGEIDDRSATEMAPVLSALADPVRLRIVSMLAAAPNGRACGCDLESPLGLTQPTVSHHLKILREAGLIVGTKEGRWVHYRLVPERLEELREALAPAMAQPV